MTGYILTLISAILYFFSFPPYSHGYLAFFSLIPLFFTLSKADSILKAACTGAIWGISLSILFSLPLYHALITEYDLSILFSSLLIIISIYLPYGIIYGIYGISFNYFYDKTGVYFPFIAASLWIILEYTMGTTPVFMPWGYTGYTQVYNMFIQISDITGIYGVSFFVVLVNSLITAILLYRQKHLKFSIIIILLLISSSLVYSVLRVHNINKIITAENITRINASIIQGNFNSKEKWDSKNTSAIVNSYINMTKKIIGESDIIVWPETVLNSSDLNNLAVISGVSSLLKQNQLFFTGATRHESDIKVYNSILAADNSGLKHIYDKKILFPFTETAFAGFSSGNFLDSPSVFNRGKTKPVYKSELTTLGFTICFEAIYPDYVRKIKNLGATALINVANDSWFGDTYEPYMHLYSSIARAIENRFYVIRSSNSGISAIISPSGEILNSIPWNNRSSITASISIIKIPTFYSRAGDWIIIISILIIILSLTLQLKFQK